MLNQIFTITLTLLWAFGAAADPDPDSPPPQLGLGVQAPLEPAPLPQNPVSAEEEAIATWDVEDQVWMELPAPSIPPPLQQSKPGDLIQKELTVEDMLRYGFMMREMGQKMGGEEREHYMAYADWIEHDAEQMKPGETRYDQYLQPYGHYPQETYDYQFHQYGDMPKTAPYEQQNQHNNNDDWMHKQEHTTEDRLQYAEMSEMTEGVYCQEAGKSTFPAEDWIRSDSLEDGQAMCKAAKKPFCTYNCVEKAWAPTSTCNKKKSVKGCGSFVLALPSPGGEKGARIAQHPADEEIQADAGQLKPSDEANHMKPDEMWKPADWPADQPADWPADQPADHSYHQDYNHQHRQYGDVKSQYKPADNWQHNQNQPQWHSSNYGDNGSEWAQQGSEWDQQDQHHIDDWMDMSKDCSDEVVAAGRALISTGQVNFQKGKALLGHAQNPSERNAAHEVMNAGKREIDQGKMIIHEACGT